MTTVATRQLETLLLIKCLGDGKANPCLPKPKRKRASCTPIRILYQLYLYQKNVDRGAWKDIRTMKETIAKNAGISRTSVTNFLNSKLFGVDLFIGIAKYGRNKGRFPANRYWLKPGIQGCLRVLEKKGFFRGIKEGGIEWRRGFEKRIENWLIPLLEKGRTFEEILKVDANMLSTKKQAKLAAVKPRKLADTTLSSKDSFTTQVDINNPVAKPNTFILQFDDLHGKLRDRLYIPDWQIKIFMMQNAPVVLASAVNETLRWTSGDWKPERMPALLQKRINEHRKRRNL